MVHFRNMELGSGGTDGYWGKKDEQLYLRDRYNSVVGGRIVLGMP